MSRKIGEVASATGLTVRTLHHYEDIGLLVASERTESGHRLYSGADLQRLYRIRLLRRLGLSLQDIRHALDDPAWSLHDAMRSHLDEVERQLDATNRLRRHLTRLLASDAAAEGPLTDDLIDLLEEMTMLDANVQRRISFLVYADLEAAYDHLTRVFGLGPGKLFRNDAGEVVHAELQAGDGVLWLHRESEQFGLASPTTLGAATAGVAIIVDDVDDHFRYAVEHGATIDYEPVDQPYGYREYSARDNEGGIWSFMTPLG